ADIFIHIVSLELTGHQSRHWPVVQRNRLAIGIVQLLEQGPLVFAIGRNASAKLNGGRIAERQSSLDISREYRDRQGFEQIEEAQVFLIRSGRGPLYGRIRGRGGLNDAADVLKAVQRPHENALIIKERLDTRQD